MLDVDTALYQPRHHIILNWKALLTQLIKGKLFETVFSKVLTNHKVNYLVHNFSLAVQVLDFKAFKLLALIYFVELQLKLIRDPRH